MQNNTEKRSIITSSAVVLCLMWSGDSCRLIKFIILLISEMHALMKYNINVQMRKHKKITFSEIKTMKKNLVLTMPDSYFLSCKCWWFYLINYILPARNWWEIWKRKRKSWIDWRQRWTSSWGTSTQHLTRYRWGNIFTLNLEQWRDLWS